MRKMSLISIVVLVILVSGVLIGACAKPAPAPTPTPAPTPAPAPAPTPAPAPIKLKLASVSPQADPINVGVQWWMDQVTLRTGGAVTFEPYWACALGAASAHLELVQKGAVDIACTTTTLTPGMYPAHAVCNFPWPFGPADSYILVKGMRQMYNEFPELKQSFTKLNVQSTLYIPLSYYRMMSKEPIRGLADLKGKRIAAVGRFFGEWFEPAGLIPVLSPAPERYTALQSGLVDIDLLPTQMHNSFRIYEVGKYYSSLLLGGWAGEFIMINLDVFHKSSPEVQKIMLDAGLEAEDFLIVYTKDYVNNALKEMKAAGVTTIEFPEEDLAKWVSMIPDVPAKAAAEVEAAGFPGWEMAKRWQEITTDLGAKWAREWAVKQ